MDKRQFHTLLNDLKDTHPDQFELIESIQQQFDKDITAITDGDKRALKTFPIQFIPRLEVDGGEWTTRLHIWAENAVPEILELNPQLLTHKNSMGDSVLMCLVVGATGAFTEVVNYELIKQILNTDFTYEEKEKNNTTEKIVIKNAIDTTDINGQTIIDYLIDFAYATGQYSNQLPDPILQEILVSFANGQEIEEISGVQNTPDMLLKNME